MKIDRFSTHSEEVGDCRYWYVDDREENMNIVNINVDDPELALAIRNAVNDYYKKLGGQV